MPALLKSKQKHCENIPACERSDVLLNAGFQNDYVTALDQELDIWILGERWLRVAASIAEDVT